MSATCQQVAPAEETRVASRQHTWTEPTLIAAGVCVLYVATVAFQFVYDDTFQITNNPWLTWRHIPDYFTKHVWAFSGISGVYWRPLFLLWLLVQHALFGVNPPGYHAATVLLHAIATALVYRVALRLAQDRATAAIAALIFGVHPALIESVAWVSGATDPLLACCLLPAFLSFLNWCESKSYRWLLASVGWYAVGLLAKEPGVMFLPLVFTFSWIQSAGLSIIRRTRSAFVAVLPHLCVTLVYAALHSVIYMRMDRSGSPATPIRTLLTAPKLLLFYLRLLVFPWPISPEYDLQLLRRLTFSSVVLPLIVLAGIAAAIYAWTRYLSRSGEEKAARTVRFASLWVLLPIVPVLNIATVAPNDIAHSRYLYMSCVGFGLVVAYLIRRIPDTGKHLLHLPFAQAAAAIAVIGLFAFANVTQQGHWSSDLLLYYRGVHVAPHNPIALTGLGTEMGRRQQYDKAVALLQDSMDQDPLDPHTNFVLGYTYYLMGRYPEAETFLQRGVSIRPEDVNADQFAYLGMVELKIGNLTKAEWAIRQAMERQPEIEKYHYALGLVLEKQGKEPEAAAAFKDTLSINPANSDARERLRRVQTAPDAPHQR